MKNKINQLLLNNKLSFGTMKKVFLTILDLSKPYIFFYIICLILQGLIPATLIILTKYTVSQIQIYLSGGQINIVSISLIWLITLLIDQILAIIAQYLQGNVSEMLTIGMNKKIMNHISTIKGLEVMEDKSFQEDLALIRKGLQFRPLNITVTLSTLLRDLIILFSVSLTLALVTWWLPFIVILSIIPYARFQLQMRENTWKLQINHTPESRVLDYDSMISLSTKDAKEIRLFNMFPWIISKYSDLSERLMHESRNIRKTTLTKGIPSLFLSGLGATTVFSYTLFASRQAGDSITMVVVAIQAIARIQQATTDIVAYFSLIVEHLNYFKKFYKLLETSDTLVNNPSGNFSGPISIELQNVSFEYPDGTMVLKNISTKISEKQVLAIVGENGSGKSTLVKLLLRFFDPTEGKILVNGVDLRSVDLDIWRERASAVFQDFSRFNYSFVDNITTGREYNESRISDVTKLTNLETVYQELPDGLATKMGKDLGGSELSGGQWQRVAIARAALKEADLMILDEPTSALDARNESEIFEHFMEISKSKTTILITHRLSSMVMADRILVLKNGEIIGDGTHLELLENSDEYSTLWNLQASKYSL